MSELTKFLESAMTDVSGNHSMVETLDGTTVRIHRSAIETRISAVKDGVAVRVRTKHHPNEVSVPHQPATIMGDTPKLSGSER